MMLERGFCRRGATRLTRRVWQPYGCATSILFVTISSHRDVAQRFSDPDIINGFNVAGLSTIPFEPLRQGLLLKFQADHSLLAAALTPC